MRVQKILCGALGSLLVLGPGVMIHGQDSAARSERIQGIRVPAVFQQQLAALGDRLVTAGKEVTVYTGRLLDKDGRMSEARVRQEASGLVQLEGFTERSSVLTFDGSETSGITSRAKDEALLEVFALDTAEGMLASVQQGAAVRVLGRGFGPDPRVEPDYKGPRYDIYEVTAPVPCRQDRLVRSKLYYFDTATGLLQSTRYYDRSVSPPVKIETRFSVWGKLDGSLYPAMMEHYVGGKLQFTFVAESIESASSTDGARIK